MSLTRLLFRNLLYHWRGNLAVLLGVAVSTAVLTGALLVGDSLRGSLADLSYQRLGWVDQALVGPRFFRAALASPNILPAQRVEGVIVLQASASKIVKTSDEVEAQPIHQVGKINLFGVDASLLPPEEEFPHNATGRPLFLNQTLANELNAKVGDFLVINMAKVSLLPRESLLGRRDTDEVVSRTVRVVVGILKEENFGAQFNLSPSPEAPRNAFISLQSLQELLNQQDRINGILAGGVTGDINQALDQHLTLDDWGLRILDPKTRTESLFAKLDRDHKAVLRRGEWQGRVSDSFAKAANADHNNELTKDEVFAYYEHNHPYLSLESRQVILDPIVVDAALKAAQETGLQAAPTLVYLANRIAFGDRAIPYSTIAALDPLLPPPLGPFLRDTDKPLAEDEILLAAWDKSPLQAKPGDTVVVSYFPPTDVGQVKEEHATFRLRGFVPLEGVGSDPDLTPEFPGITDSKTITLRDWNLPSPPFDNALIRKQVGANDEDYWKKYRTTPKAYVTLETGKKLWGNRFGQLTSIRLAPAQGQPLDKTRANFEKALLKSLNPAQGGFVFQDLRQAGQTASVGGTDFGLLFLAFSFFLIVASLLLVGLLFRLNLERRAAEIGLLVANGYRRSTVRWLLLGEGLVLALLGGIVGLLFGYAYARFLLNLLQTLWPTPGSLSFLRLHTTPSSLAISFMVTVIMSVATIFWTLRILSRLAPTALLKGETFVVENGPAARPARWSPRIMSVAVLLAIGLMVAGLFVKGHEARAGTFFSSGALVLIAGLALLWAAMKRTRDAAHAPSHLDFNVPALAWRNAARNPQRSLLTAGLLASAAFLIVAVELFRQQPSADPRDLHSGTGGFALIGETDVPVFTNLNLESARIGLAEAFERLKQAAPVAPSLEAQAKLEREKETLDQLQFTALRLKPGEDASCLNLYQPTKPSLLGVPAGLIERNAFTFSETEAKTPEPKAKPWLLLNEDLPNGEIPVIGEANTVTWILKKELGGTIPIVNDRGQEVNLRIVGLLQGSIFQSGLLMSESHFLKLFPTQEGYNVFLVDTGTASISAAKEAVDTVLADHGMEAIATTQRLESYLAVENTYLSTFQALGALGLLLGAVGLAIVLLRGIWERRAELALLQALGYRKPVLGRLLFLENGFLLLFGLGIGTLAAVLSVVPSLVGGEATVPWLKLLAMLASVLVFGLICAFGALSLSLSTPILTALRRE